MRIDTEPGSIDATRTADADREGSAISSKCTAVEFVNLHGLDIVECREYEQLAIFFRQGKIAGKSIGFIGRDVIGNNRIGPLITLEFINIEPVIVKREYSVVLSSDIDMGAIVVDALIGRAVAAILDIGRESVDGPVFPLTIIKINMGAATARVLISYARITVGIKIKRRSAIGSSRFGSKACRAYGYPGASIELTKSEGILDITTDIKDIGGSVFVEFKCTEVTYSNCGRAISGERYPECLR